MATTLFDKYGGFASISKVVMAFYDAVLDSDEVGPFFENIDMANLIDHQTKFIATVMGGPASYSDDMLEKVHAPHKIDRAAFDEVARLLRQTLEDFELEPQDVDTIMDAIAARAGVVVSG